MNSPKVIEKFKLDSTPHQNDRGLSQLVKQCLGKPLDKTYQVSNWEQRPLSEEQIKYAGMMTTSMTVFVKVFGRLTTLYVSPIILAALLDVLAVIFAIDLIFLYK